MSSTFVASLQVFVLVMFRVLAVFLVGPAFSSRSVPTQAKIGLAFFVTIVLWPLQQASLTTPLTLTAFGGAALSESLIGAMIGYVARLALAVAEIAGGIVDTQVGFRAGATLNPLTQATSSSTDQMYFLASLLLFFIVDGHHALLLAISTSFDKMPLAGPIDLAGLGGERLAALVSAAITAGCTIALPVIAVTLVLDVALAIIARAVPQVQVFFVGMPIKIGVGIALMALMAPSVVLLFGSAIGDAPRQIEWLLAAL
jgi:flagellar biosynthesis protein FliR